MAKGMDLSGLAVREDVAPGILYAPWAVYPPLLLTEDLSPTTALIRWLTFYRPISDDHIVLVPPLEDNGEGGGWRRVEQ